MFVCYILLRQLGSCYIYFSEFSAFDESCSYANDNGLCARAHINIATLYGVFSETSLRSFK